MNKKITEAFAKGKAFIPFVTCGDPSLDVTEKIVYAMEEAGADLIELGIPFSDPTAEGPVRKNPQKQFHPDGIYDLCECCFFLWNRAFLQESSRGWNGWNDPSGCSF